jgi:hypothetical protein
VGYVCVLSPRNQQTILDRLAESRMADFYVFSFEIAPKNIHLKFMLEANPPLVSSRMKFF